MSDTAVNEELDSETKTKESPEDRFIRLAKARGDKFLHQCKLLRTLGDSNAYGIDEDLVEELLATFESKLEEVRASWRAKVAKVNRVRSKKAE